MFKMGEFFFRKMSTHTHTRAIIINVQYTCVERESGGGGRENIVNENRDGGIH